MGGFSVFISYHSFDRCAVESLAAALPDRDPEIQIFYDRYDLRAGAFWMPALSQAIDDADAIILLLGSNSPGPWQLLEYYSALDRKAKQADFPIVPVVISDVAPRLPFLQLIHMIKARDLKSLQTLNEIIAALRGQPPQASSDPWQLINPYKGLFAMTVADGDFFFGREKSTIEIIDRIRRGDRFLMLVGNSGVGKSSLIEAGVIAALQSKRWPGGENAAWPEDLRDSRSWLFLRMRPGARPLRELTRAFICHWTEATSPERADLADAWEERLGRKRDIRPLIQATVDQFGERFGLPSPRRFVLVIDQSEELYTRSDDRQARRFSEVLARADQERELTVIGSIRTDHYGHLQNDEALFSVTTNVDVPPLREESLAQIVRKPAQKLGACFEDDKIPRRVAFSTARQPGALPLLSYLMEDLWKSMQARADGTMRWVDYPDLVGVTGVLARRAEKYFEKCTEEERDILRTVFALRLAYVPLVLLSRKIWDSLWFLIW